MSQYAIKVGDVQPDMKMRTHEWLNIHTGTKRFSVTVRDDGLKKWAHVYDPETGRIKFFLKKPRAVAFMQRLQRVAAPRV